MPCDASLGPDLAVDAAWSCVVDDTPKIWSCLIPWLATVAPLGRIGQSQVHLHHVCDLPPALAALCRGLGVTMHRVPIFDRRAAELNKIRQCASSFDHVGRVVLTDVDVVVNGVVPLGSLEGDVSGKTVDHPNPAIDVLRGIFSAFGLKHPAPVECAYRTSGGHLVTFETFRGNFNGGVYVIAASALKSVGERWAYWSTLLLDRRHLLGRWQRNVDQVTFCMAVNELGLAIELLDDRWNHPFHLPRAAALASPFILHHHGLLPDALRRCDDDTWSLQPCRSAISDLVAQYGLDPYG